MQSGGGGDVDKHYMIALDALFKTGKCEFYTLIRRVATQA